MTLKYEPPAPWYGGKSRTAHETWLRFGKVDTYSEPFFGMGANYFLCPYRLKSVVINDANAFISNFFRALQHDPLTTAQHFVWPTLENDLHARQIWLVKQEPLLRERLEGNPDYYGAKIAGWWSWGLCNWVGGNWCKGTGPWDSVDGMMTFVGEQGVAVRQRPFVRDQGAMTKMTDDRSESIDAVAKSFKTLSRKLHKAKVLCGDWTRAATKTTTYGIGTTAVFLDPPYTVSAGRTDEVYATEDLYIGFDVMEWAVLNGSNPLMRIALCGYEGEYTMPEDWEEFSWSSGVGKKRSLERIWFSPHCQKVRGKQLSMFDL